MFKEKFGENYFYIFVFYKYSGKNLGNIIYEFYIVIKKNGKLKYGVNIVVI